ncbi:hypothetical protein K503DRAFT_767633 [Rhizopogon vinicolor AM-OR11-026]|uniref:DUF6534 domain-containing protein n=1 Tax=Rhizopogon vinicolor AM-OR11-026 TaxID=1314800 RepID=A0A1B7N9F9_9AGAM|nr:hypothetical protein K503DRAFT_767633 [Rhizopogon vinicolor AM-OR11-026]
MASLMTGLGLSSAVFCILTAQVWIYFRRRRSRENRPTKVLVAFIWLIQAAEMGITSRMACVHTMEFKGLPQFIAHMSIEWALYLGICSLTASLVHGFFIYRVCRLEKSIYGKRKMSFILISLWIIELAFGLLSAICISQNSNDAYPSIIGIAVWSIPVSLGFSAISDILIAGTLAYVLHRNRTESRRTNRMITKLIIFCLQTGLITSIAALITIGIWAACSFEIHHLYMCFPMGGLYATCLLANLIAQESYLQPQVVNETGVTKITFAPFTPEIHVDLDFRSPSDTSSGHQETLVMQGDTVSNSLRSTASSKY